MPGCRDCEAVGPDLATIAGALASLRGGLDTGHRDFRLTVGDAQRLQRGRGLRGWLRPLAGPRFRFAQPLGSALTVVALVGLVASWVPGGSGAGAALESATDNSTSSGRESARPALNPEASPTGDLVAEAGSPKATGTRDGAFGAVSTPLSPAPSVATLATSPTSAPQPEPTPAGPPIFPASIVLLPIGLLLVVGRGLARRLVGAREP